MLDEYRETVTRWGTTGTTDVTRRVPPRAPRPRRGGCATKRKAAARAGLRTRIIMQKSDDPVPRLPVRLTTTNSYNIHTHALAVRDSEDRQKYTR